MHVISQTRNLKIPYIQITVKKLYFDDECLEKVTLFDHTIKATKRFKTNFEKTIYKIY